MSLCEEIKELLWDYDENSYDEQNCKIREHLLSCDDCRAEYAEIKEIKSRLSEIDAEAPDELKTRVMERIRADKPKKKRFIPVGTLAAAAVILVVFCVSKYVNAGFNTNGMSKDAAGADMIEAESSNVLPAYEVKDSPSEIANADQLISDNGAHAADAAEAVENASLAVDWFGVVDSLQIRTLINRIYVCDSIAVIDTNELELLESTDEYSIYMLSENDEKSVESAENRKLLTRGESNNGSGVLILRNRQK